MSRGNEHHRRSPPTHKPEPDSDSTKFYRTLFKGAALVGGGLALGYMASKSSQPPPATTVNNYSDNRTVLLYNHAKKVDNRCVVLNYPLPSDMTRTAPPRQSYQYPDDWYPQHDYSNNLYSPFSSSSHQLSQDIYNRELVPTRPPYRLQYNPSQSHPYPQQGYPSNSGHQLSQYRNEPQQGDPNDPSPYSRHPPST